MRIYLKQNLSRVSEIVIAVLITLTAFQNQAQAIENTEINHLNEVTHLEIPNIAPADYVIKKTDEKIELSVEALSEANLQKLKNYSDRFIRKIEVNKNNSLSKDVITFYLSEKNLEIFDYLTDAPSTLSIDIFAKDDSKEQDAEYEISQKLEKKSSPAKKNTKQEDFKVVSKGRDIASAEFIKTIGQVTITGDTTDVKKEAEKDNEELKKKKEVNREMQRIIRLAKMDTADILKFDTEKVNFSKDSLIEGTNRIYIKYPMLLSEHSTISDILQRDIRFEFKPSQDPVSLDFMKVRKFYTNRDYKSFLKAKKIFAKKHQSSKFDEMINYMEAEAYLKLYNEEGLKIFFDRSLKIYDALLTKYPDSPISERTLLLASYLRLKDKNYFDASRNLKTYIKLYPQSPLRENMELILAQSLVRLHEYKEAKQIYNSLFSSTAPDVKASAYYEYGDAFFEARDYEKALTAYSEALKMFPAEDKSYPNIYFNMGEIEFLLGRYKNSLEDLRKFISQHPQHEYASFAWTRMGEIFEMSEVDPKIWKGYFNESFFRFQNKLGGAIAKINLLYHQALTSPPKKFEYIIDQMKAYENQIALPQANEYLHFKISDAYYETGNYKKSVQVLMDHFKTGDVPEHVEKFHKRIGRGLAAQLRSLVAQNNILEGLKLFDQTDNLWFKKSKRFDFSFYKGELFRHANLYSKAHLEYEKYLVDFANVKNQQDLDKSQKMPYLVEVHLRNAEALLALSQSQKAQEQLSKINRESLAPELQDEYSLANAQLLAQNEKPEQAIEELKKISKPTVKHLSFLLDQYQKTGQTNEAISTIDQQIEKQTFSELDRFLLLKKKVSILEVSKDKKFPEFLARFYNEFKDKKFDFDREKYLLYRNLSEQNKTKEASEVFSRIQPNSYWARLAKEVQEDDQWSQKYKKYVDRIPAMQPAKENSNGSN